MRLTGRPRLLLIAQANSYRIAPFLQAAKRMGLEAVIASHGEFSLISEVHTGLHVDLDNTGTALAGILDAAARTPFAGILGSDDSTVELAACAAQALGLPHNPPQAARLSRRKDLARAHLALAGCPVPTHCLIALDQPLQAQMAGLPWPCVIKPLNMSASRGVIRADDEAGFIAACRRIKPIISSAKDDFEATHVLVEDYIDGIEVAYEGYLHNGELTTLALFDKPDPLQGPYFEETIYVTPSQLDGATQAGIKQRVARACSAYGLRTGPVHAELRIDKHDAWILEVAARTIGGDCARILDSGMTFNLEELVIALAIGRPVQARSPGKARGVMMIPVRRGGILRRVEGIGAARSVPGVDKVDVIIREGNELVPLPEGNQYPGYIFARGDSADEVVCALREACSRLDFVVAPVFKITPQ
ncbi:MAG: ATP-grasp domain-containing protein [Thiogranum sp.]